MVEEMSTKCPLCNLDLNKETILYEDSMFMILRTKDLKGHRERIMIVAKEHAHKIRNLAYEIALNTAEKIGKKAFNYAPKFIIMDSTFASIKEHWHLVMTDLNPKSEDFDQIMVTRWVRVIDNVNDDVIV